MTDDSANGYRWTLPESNEPLDKRQLRIHNSFTRKKELFIANDRKTIKWYCCGPTVYDVAHLGHARCYITFDIMRRILAEYFGFQVFYVMNITDIDDKIIHRARSNYLCDKFIDNFLAELKELKVKEKSYDAREYLVPLEKAIESFQKRRADEPDKDKRAMNANISHVSSKALESLNSELSQFINTEAKLSSIHKLLQQMRETIADEQDILLGHTIENHEVFKNLTLQFEQEFHNDMQRLDVLSPSVLTRVSEFIHEIGAYIVKLEQNGFAYRSGGSIYFDTDKFDSRPQHSYAKLVREAYGCKGKDLEEGEGVLSKNQLDKKKSVNDFALWKKSKTGEPSWQTQDFDAGRPGWHIECSVMASKLLGENFDIHSGGHDLRFPHHDNEIAQAEAYYNTGKNWVNYFVHSGHLTISGCKMSKSLKNFITIRQALEEYSSRQLRFAFLAHGWTETLDYSPNTMSTALSYEKTFREFFLNTSERLRTITDGSCLSQLFKKWSDDDCKLNEEFLGAINKVDTALCDNFDTRSTLNVLCSLVKECNKRETVSLKLIWDIASYIKQMLSIFGANFTEINLERYFSAKCKETESTNHNDSQPNSTNQQEAALKYVETLAQFRADIRKISKESDAQQSIKQILGLCDALRDKTLPDLGVRLEDRESGDRSYVVKFVDAETLARERSMAEKREQEAKVKRETERLEKLKLQQQRDEKAKMPPSEMFREQTDKYSQFDATGMPTHDSTGKEISKSALKKLQRLYAEQEARYHKFIESQSPQGQSQQ